MIQGIIFWFISLLLAYSLVSVLRQRFTFLKSSYMLGLFLYHSVLAAAYYIYALSNVSDSKGYYRKVFEDFRGPDWGSFYGTSTRFIEFFGYPFIKYMGFSYESMMVLCSFLGFVGFVFFYIVFKERITFSHQFLFLEFSTLIFFLPNLHFWSSSFGKGSLIFCGFGLFFYGINKPGSRIWALITGGFLIYMVRPHIFFVVLIAMTISYTFSTKGVKPVFRYFVLGLTAFLLYFIYDDIMKITGLEDESVFDSTFSDRASGLSRATSGIDIANYNIFEKMFAFWFRPLFFDAPGFLGIIVSFENLIYLFIFASLLRPKAISFILNSDVITKTCLLTFLGVSFALAQITGNLGLAIRQKSQVMILMMFVILKFVDEQKIVQFRQIAFRKKIQELRLRRRTDPTPGT